MGASAPASRRARSGDDRVAAARPGHRRARSRSGSRADAAGCARQPPHPRALPGDRRLVRAIVEQATRDLTTVRARLEAAEAHAETAERRARAAETQVEELELWLNRIEALLSEELAATGLPAADDPFDGLLESQDGDRRELYREAPQAADTARPAAERGRPGGLRSAIAALRRIVAVP